MAATTIKPPTVEAIVVEEPVEVEVVKAPEPGDEGYINPIPDSNGDPATLHMLPERERILAEAKAASQR